MALPLLAGAAGTAAIAAYMDAKYHIRHDIRSGRGGFPAENEVLGYIESKAASKRTLLYYILEEHATDQPHHPFLIFEGMTWTYRQFVECITRIGNWLMNDLGVQVGEMVAIDGANSPEYLMLWFALDAIGAATSFINWNLTGTGLVHCIKICECRYLITDSDVRNNVEPSRPDIEALGVTIKYYDPSFFESLSDYKRVPDSRRENVSIESTRGLIYTSGTTGLPKAVIFKTGRELATGFSTARYLQLKPESRMYTCMPLYHGAAHGLCTTPCIVAGSTIVLGRKFSHKTFWPEVAQSKATIVQYVGELCRYLLNGPPNQYERAHRVQVAWGNGMRPDVWEPFRERFNIPVINELYAATDGLGATFNRNNGPFSAHAIGLRGALWNWRYSDLEVRVKMDVDTEDIMRDENGFAIRCGVNEPGQVIHRLTPETIASQPGYFNNDEATTKRRITDVFEKGDMWFKSGDMMRQDKDGRVFFVDRLGDTFRWKSENVSTNEVADMIGQYHQIAETNAYGVQVPGYDGRAGMACVVMADGIVESTFDFTGLAAHARAVLPGYAVPLFLRMTPALDYTGTLKMQKGKLKKEGIDPDLLSGDDKVYWLPPGSDRYVPFEYKDWEAIKDKRVRLT
ncbi:long-chain fatty acid transporter-like protein [Polyplosphaeria fusca]|uniref:Very long-chain fatty acid transport protein n=1 Tax=Polyplosphaeria fusca TaxID=682080 RepID=A0A9P4RAR9_9PLEO|nr:long-chain fatty acid transporter-like protein [Polyplosphaeria fusca]